MQICPLLPARIKIEIYSNWRRHSSHLLRLQIVIFSAEFSRADKIWMRWRFAMHGNGRLVRRKKWTSSADFCASLCIYDELLTRLVCDEGSSMQISSDVFINIWQSPIDSPTAKTHSKSCKHVNRSVDEGFAHSGV